jgi:hypothetical protein
MGCPAAGASVWHMEVRGPTPWPKWRSALLFPNQQEVAQSEHTSVVKRVWCVVCACFRKRAALG